MSKPAIYRLGLSAFARSSPGFISSPAKTTAEKVEAASNEDYHNKHTLKLYGAPEHKQSLQQHLRKTFTINIGANLQIPCKDNKDLPRPEMVEDPSGGKAVAADPFAGMPFRALADRLGEQVAPAFQEVLQQQRTQKPQAAMQAAQTEQDVHKPYIPHLLPFTRWAAQSKTFEKTLIADPPNERKKARLSWYNPNDGMVPSGWWKMGLLEDLKYYRPFMN